MDTGATQVSNKTHLGKVLNITWRSEGSLEDSKWANVALSEPRADEECPITQELMCSAQSGLDFLPGVTFSEDNPTYRRLELECGHAFSAVPLTYHFFKNGMQCPLCRAGTPMTLATMCVPLHFRKAMQSHRASEREQDRLDMDRDDLATAMMAAQDSVVQIMGEGDNVEIILERIRIVAPFRILGDIAAQGTQRSTAILEHTAAQEGRRPTGSVLGGLTTQLSADELASDRLYFFLQSHPLCLLVYVYETGEDVQHSAVFEFPLIVFSTYTLQTTRNEDANDTNAADSRHEDRMLNATLALDSLRELARNTRTLEHPVRYVFVVGTRSLSDSVVEVARSSMADLMCPHPIGMPSGGMFVPCDIARSGFEVRHLEGYRNGTRELGSVAWAIPERLFLSTALSRITQVQDAQFLRVPGASAAYVVID